jgi:hypothetical protein
MPLGSRDSSRGDAARSARDEACRGVSRSLDDGGNRS